MNSKLKEKISEAFSSVLPITLIVLILSTLVVPIAVGTIAMFLVGAALLVVGMGFFSLGADMAMIPMGEGIGKQLGKVKKRWLIVGIAFLIGFLITIAEPDLEVLARQVTAIPTTMLVLIVAAGTGIFLVVALLRVLFSISLNNMLILCYGAVFLISAFVPDTFLSVAFDSGGVTTGPVTVPFILALGAGLAAVSGSRNSDDDSFGMVALCSIGPILAVMILGILFNPGDMSYEQVVFTEVETMQDVVKQFVIEIPQFAKEVMLALIPIVLFLAAFQVITKRFTKRSLVKITVGIAYTFIGLVLFLTGVSVGFIPVGGLLGSELAGSSYPYLLIPIGAVMGFFIVSAEPAIHVLNKQVEEISGGSIPAKAMNLSLAVGVSASVALSMVRVLTGISIYWFLIPGYLTALFLSFFVPKIFTGIAFDSGGVASGPMTTTFLLPFAMGACEAVGGNMLTDAFGIVATVAMTPLIAIQVMGFIYKKKIEKSLAGEREIQEDVPEFLDLDEEDEQCSMEIETGGCIH